MSNKLSIDDLFRQELKDAREPNHLGAWANMQQMLDGNNPYVKKDYKRRYLGLILLLICFGAGSMAIKNYIYSSQSSEATMSNHSMSIARNEINGKYTKSKSEDQCVQQVTESIENTLNTDTRNVNLSSEQDQNFTNTLSSKSDLENNSMAKNDPRSTEMGTIADQSKVDQNDVYSRISTKYDNLEKLAMNKKSLPIATSKHKITPQSAKSKNPIQSSEAVNYDLTMATQSNMPAKNLKSSMSVNKVENLNRASTQIATNLESKHRGTSTKTELVPNTDPEFLAINKSSQANPILLLQELIGLPAQSIVHTQNLSKTARLANSVHPTITAWNIDKLYTELSNNLGAKQIENVNHPLVPIPAVNPLGTSAHEHRTAITESKASVEDTSKKVSLTKAAAPTALSAMSAGIIGGIKEAMQNGRYKLGHLNIPVNPGFFAGVNGSFFNTDHDAGGFQLASNLLMDISKKWYLVPGLGFYYRNNGGYTVRDYNITIGNKQTVQIDSTRYAYSYTKDSSISTYNFKHYYTLEAPLLLEYKLKNKGLYGGLNVAYGFKMKTQNKRNNYSSLVTDTLNSISYQFPTNTLNYFKPVDFNSRLGIGYVVGFNATFSQRLFFDARYVQNVYDNSATQSAVTMSKKFFRTGSIQLNLGYRFGDRR